MMTNEKEKVINAYLNGVQILDGHSSSKEEITEDTSLVILAGTDRPLCLFIKGSRYCCLNGLYLDEKNQTLILSQASEGGVVMGSDLTEENVSDYNKSVSFDSIKIIEWIDRDGSIHSTEDA